MKTLFVEDMGGSQRLYNSVVVGPKKLKVLSSEMALKIVGELAKEPLCAMDVAKRIKQHEQKVYYHLRKMRDAGIIKLVATENRYGMTAKLFELVSPTITAKLHEDGFELDNTIKFLDPEIRSLLNPFVKDGKINSKVIIGDPYPHGPFDYGSRDGVHVFDLAMLIGAVVKAPKFLNYLLDTGIDSSDLQENIILFGEPKANTIINSLNENLPVHFDYIRGYEIVSKQTKEVYDAPRIGIVVKAINPWNKSKRILILSGIGVRGVGASIIAATQYANKLTENADEKGCFAHIVEGLDKNGDGNIDSVRFLE